MSLQQQAPRVAKVGMKAEKGRNELGRKRLLRGHFPVHNQVYCATHAGHKKGTENQSFSAVHVEENGSDLKKGQDWIAARFTFFITVLQKQVVTVPTDIKQIT